MEYVIWIGGAAVGGSNGGCVRSVRIQYQLRRGILPRVRRRHDECHEFQVTKEETRHVRPYLSGR